MLLVRSGHEFLELPWAEFAALQEARIASQAAQNLVHSLADTLHEPTIVSFGA